MKNKIQYTLEEDDRILDNLLITEPSFVQLIKRCDENNKDKDDER